jgi:hypothetical protein
MRDKTKLTRHALGKFFYDVFCLLERADCPRCAKMAKKEFSALNDEEIRHLRSVYRAGIAAYPVKKRG